MKTGKEVFSRALQLLGYTNAYGEVDGTQSAELFKRGTAAVEQILTDLRRIEDPNWIMDSTLDMEAPLPLSNQAINDAMPYGVAMLLAQGESDGDSQALYSALYNAKRAGVRRPKYRIRDVMPRGGY